MRIPFTSALYPLLLTVTLEAQAGGTPGRFEVAVATRAASMLDPLIVARMKKVRTERIALVTSGVGMALMILTTVWRVNPVEGSVSLVPESLEGNPFGEALMYVLLVTCMPVWIPTVFSVVVLAGPPESDSVELANGAAVIVQGIVYFMFGKLISGWAKRRSLKKVRPTKDFNEFGR